MLRRSSGALRRVVGRIERYSPPQHRELVRGMVAELDSLSDPAEQARFARGAIAAIAHLALGEFVRTLIHAPGRFVAIGGPEDGADPGGPSMSTPTTRQILRRHATPFAVSLVSLTAVLLASDAIRRVARLRASGSAGAGEIVEVLLLTVPHTLALTLPMAVFLAVSWVFARLGAEGVLTAARLERHGIRRLVAPVAAAAAVIAALTLVVNTHVVPSANARLVAVLEGAPRAPTDRTMSVGQLREAVREARQAAGPQSMRAAAYEVEIQKKFALAAACLVLALAAAATAVRFPRGGTRLVLVASGLVFAGYYVSLIAGESLADRRVISPLAGMWMANVFLLAVVLLLLWRSSRTGPAHATEALVIGG